MADAHCQHEGCDQPSSAATAFCPLHQTGFRWHRGDWVIHCEAPGAYRAVHRWVGNRRAFPTFAEAEQWALARTRGRGARNPASAA